MAYNLFPVMPIGRAIGHVRRFAVRVPEPVVLRDCGDSGAAALGVQGIPPPGVLGLLEQQLFWP
jgi:hypothetical protein